MSLFTVLGDQDQVAKEPQRSTRGSVGYDLRSNSKEPIYIPKWSQEVIPTGYGVEGEKAAFVLSRSGLAAKNGVSVLNAPGLIDMDYEGEIKIILSTRSTDFTVNFNDRIAQLVFFDDLDYYSRRAMLGLPSHTEDLRGSGGFGSSGVK